MQNIGFDYLTNLIPRFSLLSTHFWGERDAGPNWFQHDFMNLGDDDKEED